MQPQVHAWLLLLAIVLIRTAQPETTAHTPQDISNITVDGQDSSNSTRKINPFILAGHLSRSQFPFIAKLRWMYYYKRPKGAVDEFRCTAVIISQEFVLTAASCFQIIILEQKKKDDVTLDIPLTRDYGRTFVEMDETDSLQNAVIRRVRSGVRLLVHKSYLHPSTMFDVNIALVQVVPRWSVKEVNTLKTPIPSLNLTPDDGNLYNCIGVGTGKVRPGPYSWEDQEKSWLELRTGGVGYCKFLHKEFSKQDVHVDKFYMCGKSVLEDQDFCNGDLGSALVCNGLLSGILSQRIVKKPCQVSGKQFTMFTAVGAKPVYDWIKLYVPDFETPKVIPPPPDPWDETRLWGEDVGVGEGETPFVGGENVTTLISPTV